MSRGVGEFDLLQGAVPDALALLVALLTQLGDVWFVTLCLLALFVRFDRDRIATVGGLAIGAIALTFALKYLFVLPRPDLPLIALEALPAVARPIYGLTGYASGYGFPSGHAVVTTVVYLALAERLPVSRRRNRYAVAVTVIALVGLSRIVLGLHYLVDVVVGIALGLALLVGTRWLLARYRTPARQRTVALGLGVVLAGTSVLVAGLRLEPVALLSVSVVLFSLSVWFGGSWNRPG
ncbi:phosphatase PAP2 family protein [Natronorarus salvus]|uniref:phosphatase PAP2 family protein n=1 Tax=Natronorarus salvus TaxID=3117733 RepID=UPI002F26161E